MLADQQGATVARTRARSSPGPARRRGTVPRWNARDHRGDLGQLDHLAGLKLADHVLAELGAAALAALGRIVDDLVGCRRHVLALALRPRCFPCRRVGPPAFTCERRCCSSACRPRSEAGLVTAASPSSRSSVQVGAPARPLLPRGGRSPSPATRQRRLRLPRVDGQVGYAAWASAIQAASASMGGYLRVECSRFCVVPAFDPSHDGMSGVGSMKPTVAVDQLPFQRCD